jgi:hypothetical protein
MEAERVDPSIGNERFSLELCLQEHSLESLRAIDGSAAFERLEELDRLESIDCAVLPPKKRFSPLRSSRQ